MTIDPQDRQEIMDLISNYNYSFDHGDWDAFAALWADDAIQRGRAGESRSKEAILATYQAAYAELKANSDLRWYRHHTTNTVLREAGEGRAVGRTRWFSHASRASETRTVLGNSGHYHDEFVRTPEGWRFASRRIERNQ